MKTSNKQAKRQFVFLLASLLFLTSPLADALPSEGRGLCAKLGAAAIAEEGSSPEAPPAQPAEEKPAEAPKAPEEKPPEVPKAPEEQPAEPPKAPEEQPDESSKAPEEKPSDGESNAPSSAPEVTVAPDSGENPPPSDAPADTPETGASPDATLSPDASAAPEGSVSPSDTLNPDASAKPDKSVGPITEDQSPDGGKKTEPVIMCPRVSGSGWYGEIPSDGQGMPVPILYQGDYRETVCMIGEDGRSVATSGCGAASASMVIAYVTGDTSQNPYTLFYDAVESGRYFGSGLGHDTISWFLNSYGVSCTWISNTGDGIRQALESGNPVIAHMGPGIFTTTGHYIVLRGLTEDGEVLVNDPASPSRTHTTYSIETLLKQARGSNSFLVCLSNKPLPVRALSATEDAQPAPTPEPAPDVVGQFGVLPLPIAELEREAT